MNLWVWIIVIALFGIGIYFFIKRITFDKKLKVERWGEIPCNTLIKKSVTIPLENNQVMQANIYTSADFKEYLSLPLLIIAPQQNKNFIYNEYLGAAFALQGYISLVLGYCDEYQDKPLFIRNNLNHYPKIKEFALNLPKADKTKFALFGLDYGAEIMVRTGIIDPDVKIILAASMPRVPIESLPSKFDGEKIRLVHCMNDEIVPLSDFLDNLKVFKISEQNYLTFQFGGHDLYCQEAAALGFVSAMLKEALQPKIKQVVKKEAE
ncbi:MAG: hypothetical protein HWN65_21255 [Candidatus Helarchaeota archaeon]|nr:hypothetical protein [Candidatus Helarchaeota archaeon]